MTDKRKSLEKNIVNGSRPLPSIPTPTCINSHLKPSSNTNITKAAAIAGTDKMSTLQVGLLNFIFNFITFKFNLHFAPN